MAQIVLVYHEFEDKTNTYHFTLDGVKSKLLKALHQNYWNTIRMPMIRQRYRDLNKYTKELELFLKDYTPLDPGVMLTLTPTQGFLFMF